MIELSLDTKTHYKFRISNGKGKSSKREMGLLANCKTDLDGECEGGNIRYYYLKVLKRKLIKK